MLLLTVSILGVLLGRIAAGWAAVTLADMYHGGLVKCLKCEEPVSWWQRWGSPFPIKCNCGKAAPIRWHAGSAVTLGGLFALFTIMLLDANCQTVTEVRPDSGLASGRLPFHLTLIALLWVATLTDLLDYVIADDVIYVGIIIAVAAAFATGELQMIHVWVNWDDAVEGLRGPYLPEWMKHHQHLHGLAWSLAGALAGALLTWLVRAMASLILGYQALGFGDVTLMAMIGAFLGWQPTLCVLAIAPLVSVCVGLIVRITTGRTFVAYGPYLACSALIVISSWRWLWVEPFMLRDIFSHWPSVAGLIGFSLGTLMVLLIGLRLFRAMPVDRIQR